MRGVYNNRNTSEYAVNVCMADKEMILIANYLYCMLSTAGVFTRWQYLQMVPPYTRGPGMAVWWRTKFAGRTASCKSTAPSLALVSYNSFNGEIFSSIGALRTLDSVSVTILFHSIFVHLYVIMIYHVVMCLGASC